MGGHFLYLSRKDVERVALPMSEIIRAVEQAFMEKAGGGAEAPPKPGIHPQADAFIHAMPAYLPSVGAAGIKWVSGFPSNPPKGLPYISGLLILNEPETGVPSSVMDCTWITAKRTAAASALGARYLAREDSELLGVCGCGVQGRAHVEALVELFPKLARVYAYDISQEAADRFLDEMRNAFPKLDFQKSESPRRAVSEADLVVTAGPILKRPDATIQPGWIKPGAFATAVDFDSYWTPLSLKEMDLIVTDDKEQFEYYRSQGYFQAVETVHGELSDLVSGRMSGRSRPDQRTMAMFLGLAIEDMATALRILERARQLGIGTMLPL